MVVAPEMSRNLRQLIDNSFEEAQFESAVFTLDILRSPDHSPSPIHMLHLIFISLHPSTHPSNLEDPTSQPLTTAALLLQSPRKMIKHTKSSALLLSPPAVLASHRALHAFLRTNGPDAFSRALPSYAQYKLGGGGGVDGELEYVDSPIQAQAVAIRNARAVWDVIKEGYTLRVAKALPAPVKGRGAGAGGKGKGKGLGRDTSFTAPPPPSTTDWSAREDVKPVGEDAWQVLDWFVELFEADAERTSTPKHSLFLLSQLPPPPIGSHTRWDASEPLKVVFYALGQDDVRRQRIGLRLLLLLIDLSHTTYLNLPSFASSVLVQLSAAASASSSASSSSLPSFSPSPFPSSNTASSTSTASSSTSSPSSSNQAHPKRGKETQKEKETPHQKALTRLLTFLPSSTPAQAGFRMVLCRKILAGLEVEGAGGAGKGDAMVSDTVANAISGDIPFPSSSGTASSSQMATANANATTTMAANANATGPTTGTTTTTTNANTNARPRPKPVPKRRKIEVEGEGGVGAGASSAAPPTITKPTAAPAPAPAPLPPSIPPQPQARLQYVPVPTLDEMSRLLSLVPPPAVLRVARGGGRRTSTKRKAHPTTTTTNTMGGKAKMGGKTATRTTRAASSSNSKPKSNPVPPTRTIRTTRASSRSRSVVPSENPDVDMKVKEEVEDRNPALGPLAEDEAEEEYERGDTEHEDHGQDTEHDHEEPEHPYTTPRALLVRVRFEFVMGWMGFVRCKNNSSGADKTMENVNAKEMEEKKREREELGRLIERFFGESAVAAEEEEEVKRDMKFYHDVLTAFASV